MSFGLALSGGGIRGAAHVGVLLALEENGLKPRALAGTSAGSIVAGLYAAGVPVKEMIEYVHILTKKGISYLDPSYFQIIRSIVQLITKKPICLTGLITGNKMERYLKKLTNNINIRDIKTKLVIPCVDVNSGYTIAYTNVKQNISKKNKVIWKNDLPLCKVMRASSAIPGVFQPLYIDNMCLVDGGVTDGLPVNLLKATGENNILAVDLAENKIPENKNIFDIILNSFDVIQNNLKAYISHDEKLLINPVLPENAEILSYKKMDECMEAGYNETIKMMPVIKTLFG